MALKKEIVSKMKTITDVMITENNLFFIPDFQRSFVWGKEEIKRLLDDFSEDTEMFSIETSELEGYLLGNIVLIEQEDGKSMVIDGQQRLTTITLIFRALHKIVQEKAKTSINSSKWMNKMGDLQKGYCVLNDADEFQSLRLMHDASLKFGGYYNKLFLDSYEGEDFNLSEKDIETAEDQNIYDVYTEAYEYLLNLEDNELNRFINYFKTKVKLIVTSAPTESKAFQLFEILNDRGRSLEPMDLIKNTFLKVLHQEGRTKNQIEMFIEDWQSTISNLQIGKKKITSSSFLKQYILSYKGVNVHAKDMFDYMKKPETGLTKGNEIIKFTQNMNKASIIINQIEKKDYSEFDDKQNMYILFEMLGIKQFYPILIIIADKTQEQKTKVLNALVRYGAATVFSFTQTNSIERDLPQIISDYLVLANKNSDIAINTLLEKLEEKIKNIALITKAIVAERNFVGNKDKVHTKALELLKFIELYFNNNTKVRIVPKGKKLTAEHIQSQNMSENDMNLSELGYASEEERKAFLHRIGNLTILYNSDNASLGNVKYEQKKMCYAGSDFIITSTLVNPVCTTQKNGKDTKQCQLINKYEPQYLGSKDGQWTKSDIIERSKQISDLVYRILVDELI